VLGGLLQANFGARVAVGKPGRGGRRSNEVTLRIAVTGSTGLIGGELTRGLRGAGHHITRVVRSFGSVPSGERAVVWHPDEGIIEAAGLEAHDVVIHTAGESIAGVWTESKKRRIRESRLRGTRLLAQTLAGLKQPPRALFSASAFGIYGDRPAGEAIDESSAPGTGFLAELAVEWEAATRAAEAAGIRVVHMRFGNVLSRRGGMLPVLLPLYRLGLGARLGSGAQYWPWIADADLTPALLHVLERPDMSGPVNFVAPQPATNAEFTDTLAAVVGRPSFLKLPGFAAKLAPGGMGEEMLLGGARVVPQRLLDSGYTFKHPELRGALRAVLAK
jgi:uncharacterized protein